MATTGPFEPSWIGEWPRPSTPSSSRSWPRPGTGRDDTPRHGAPGRDDPPGLRLRHRLRDRPGPGPGNAARRVGPAGPEASDARVDPVSTGAAQALARRLGVGPARGPGDDASPAGRVDGVR